MTERAPVDNPVRYFLVMDDRTAEMVSSEVIVRLERTCRADRGYIKSNQFNLKIKVTELKTRGSQPC